MDCLGLGQSERNVIGGGGVGLEAAGAHAVEQAEVARLRPLTLQAGDVRWSLAGDLRGEEPVKIVTSLEGIDHRGRAGDERGYP